MAWGMSSDHKTPDTRELIGTGLYRTGEAARLIDLSVQRLRRWAVGRAKSGGAVHPALGFTIGDETFLDFRDLMELRVIAALVREGLAPRYVAAIYAHVADAMEDERPFSVERFHGTFRTDGKRLYAWAVDATGGAAEEVLTGQRAFARIIAPSLRNVEFDGGTAARWRPEQGRNDVVLDPERSFGRPLDDETGVPTATLAASHARTGSFAATAKEFEVGERSVRSAVHFEERLAA